MVLLPEGAVAAIPQTEEARVASLEAAVRSGRAESKARNPARGATVGVARAAVARASVLKPKAGLTTWLMWGALALALYFLIVQLSPDRNLESSESATPQQGP